MSADTPPVSAACHPLALTRPARSRSSSGAFLCGSGRARRDRAGVSSPQVQGANFKGKLGISTRQAIKAALDPALLEHRDFVYRTSLTLPIDT